MREARGYKKEGKHEEAIALCGKVLEMESEGISRYHLEANLEMGDMLVQLDRYEDAMAALEAAVKIASDDPRAHYALGMIYKHYGDETGKISWYNKAIIEFEKTKMSDSKFADVSTQLSELRKKR